MTTVVLIIIINSCLFHKVCSVSVSLFCLSGKPKCIMCCHNNRELADAVDFSILFLVKKGTSLTFERRCKMDLQ